jgi:hypothetical protein
MSRPVYAHARMVCMGTLNYGDASFYKEETAAMGSARYASARTSLAVIVFSFTEGHLKDGTPVLGGFEEGREMTAQEARERLAHGYGETP